MRPLNILTWHVHGNYLYYLSHIPHFIYLPVTEDRHGDYCGKSPGFPWGENVIEVDVEHIPDVPLDCVIFQRPDNYFIDQFKVLTEAQRTLPRIYLEHDPPRGHPTDSKHWVRDPDVLLVHVTPFNSLMWDSGPVPKMVIKHGVVTEHSVHYKGDIEQGLVVINNLRSRFRRLGADIYELVKAEIPLTLIGMDSQAMGGIGEISHRELNEFESHYRFFFNPIRYTSLGLAVCEAMMIGLPVVGFATTEMAVTVQNGISGYIDTDVTRLKTFMRRLLDDRGLARHLGEGARRYAEKHFNIGRFVDDWGRALELVTQCGPALKVY